MKQIYLKDFMTVAISDLQDAGRYGTAHVHRSVLRSILEYAGNKLAMSKMTPAFLKEYENYLIMQKKLEWNTSSTYMRCLQAAYNQALDRGMVPFIPRQFSGVFRGALRNHRRALSPSDMRRLLSDRESAKNTTHITNVSNLPKENTTETELSDRKKTKSAIDKSTSKARACLELMLRLRGLSFVDLAFLRKSDFHEGYLILRRHKTGTPLRIRVSEDTLKLLRQNVSQDPHSPYLLNILDGRLTGYEAYQDYQSKLRHLNTWLKNLAKSRKVQSRVSSYCARHTWATQAKYCGIPTSVISEGLGHASVTTTEAYLKAFDNGVLDRANETVVDYILLPKKKK